MNKRFWPAHFWVFLLVVLAKVASSSAKSSAPTTKQETIYRNGVKGFQTVSISTGAVVSCCRSADGNYYSYVTTVITASTILVNNAPIATNLLVPITNNSYSATVRTNLAPALMQIYKQAGYVNIQTISLDNVFYKEVEKKYDIRVTNYIQSKGSLSVAELDPKLKNATDTLWIAGTFSSLFGKDQIGIKAETVTIDLTGDDFSTGSLIALVALVAIVPIAAGISCCLCRNRWRARQRQGMVIMPAGIAPYPPTYPAYPNNGGAVFVVPENRPVA